MEDWRYHDTPSGTPQGGIISPLLANIYLNELDRFVEDTLMSDVHTRRADGGRIPAYTRRAQPADHGQGRQGDLDEVKRLKAERRKLMWSQSV